MAMAMTLRRRQTDYENPDVKSKVRKTITGYSDLFHMFTNPQTSIVHVTFDHGPAALNLYNYIAEESRFLWSKTTPYFILKPESEPKKGILLFHKEGEDLRELCWNFFQFDPHSTNFTKVHLKSSYEEDFACVFYLGKHLWNLMETTNEQPLKDMVRNVKKTHIFFITDSEKEKEDAINVCRKNKICPPTHIFSTESDKCLLYKTMYKILEIQITSFLSDLNCKASTRSVKHFTSELDVLLGTLHSRKEKSKCSLTRKCIERIKNALGAGFVGHRLCGDVLYVFEEDETSADVQKKFQIRNSIQEAFSGKVYFKLLKEVMSQQCTIKCGGPIGKITGETGTIGVFGKLKNTTEDITVAISSGHVIEADADAFVPQIGNVGQCIWPFQSSKIFSDVSVIKINSALDQSLRRVILDENITLQAISTDYLENRSVFKFGATTGFTEGFIGAVDTFQLFGENVMTIKPKRSKYHSNKFSDKGDSGAIVLTRMEKELHAIGVIYGDCFDFREFDNLHPNESVAVFLRSALDRFTNATQQDILFDKI